MFFFLVLWYLSIGVMLFPIILFAERKAVAKAYAEGHITMLFYAPFCILIWPAVFWAYKA